jgi:hypothetical protein
MCRALKRARKAGRGLVGCRVSEWQLALANFDGLPRAATSLASASPSGLQNQGLALQFAAALTAGGRRRAASLH